MGQDLTFAEMAKDLDPEGPILDYLLLDIEIFDTDIEGCRAFLQAMLDAPYKSVVDVHAANPPDLDLELALRRLEDEPDPEIGDLTEIKIDMGSMVIRCHLHDPEWIDMDCPPQHVNASSFGDLCAFMRRAGRATGCNVYGTAERRPAQAFFAYIVEDDGFVRIRRPEKMTTFARELANELRGVLRPLRPGKGPCDPERATTAGDALARCVPPLNDLRWHTQLTRHQADWLLSLERDLWVYANPGRTGAYDLDRSVAEVRRAFDLDGRSAAASG